MPSNFSQGAIFANYLKFRTFRQQTMGLRTRQLVPAA